MANGNGPEANARSNEMNRKIKDLTVYEISVLMGNEATLAEANTMKRILISAGYAKCTPEGISNDEWRRASKIACLFSAVRKLQPAGEAA